MEEQKSALMTSGPIWQRIVFFAVPLFFGNLFQQLYNTADSLIVGKFLGDTALAAVSSSGSLILLLVGFFNGISAGGGVVVARYYGARDTERVKRTVHTMVAFGLAAGVGLTVIGVVLGLLAGYFGGVVDMIIMRFTDMCSTMCLWVFCRRWETAAIPFFIWWCPPW